MAIEPCLSCRDIRASIEFYIHILDFELIVAPSTDPHEFGSRYAALSRDGDILHLSSHAHDDGVFGAEIYIRVDNVDEVCSKLVASDINLRVPEGGTSPVDQTWGMREVGIRDPDGNKITFGQTLE